VNSPNNNRCGQCHNCRVIKNTRRLCLAAVNPPITPPGNGEHVRIVWNDMLAAYPCEGKSLDNQSQETVQGSRTHASP